jgi:cytochrome c-type biogenesis protein CcmE
MLMIGLVLTGVIVAAAFALRAFRENLLYFFSPSQIAAGEAPEGRTFRLGGVVVEGSVEREVGSLTVEFVVTDFAHSLPVEYTGPLPDLFKEGQGVVALGRLEPRGTFVAEEVLAKHDENYMPPEVADALKRARGAPQAQTETEPR